MTEKVTYLQDVVITELQEDLQNTQEDRNE